MTTEQAEDLKNLWEAKLANHRKVRKDSMGTCYAQLTSKGIAQGGRTPGKLYEIAIQNLGELNQIYRETFEDGWTIDEDTAWAKIQLEQYKAFNSNEKELICREISDFLKSKSFQDNPALFVDPKNDLELSNRVHLTRFEVLVHQRIGEHEKRSLELKRTDSRWEQEHAIRIGTIALLLGSTFITIKSYKRTQRLFIGEDSPQVQAVPYAIGENSKTHNSTISFELVNYTGFDAKDVSIDVKYCVANSRLRHWAGEWVKANIEVNGKAASGVVEDSGYFFAAPSKVDLLPRFTKVDTKERGLGIAADALHIETDVCNQGDLGLPVLVRVRWRNEKGRAFDEIHKYKLLCTKNWIDKNTPRGRAFAFTPELGMSCAQNE